MKTIKTIVLMSIIVVSAIHSTAQNHDSGKMPMKPEGKMIQRAVCILHPTEGNAVSGIVTFTRVDGGVRVVADLTGLSQGKHGIHIHECGDCSAADGSSAGGHFNPMGRKHAGPEDAMRHEGDMGNIIADANGKAHFEYLDNQLSFEGMNSIIGRSVIVHKDSDDLKTQPTGNSGPRVACGVIGIGK